MFPNISMEKLENGLDMASENYTCLLRNVRFTPKMYSIYRKRVNPVRCSLGEGAEKENILDSLTFAFM